METDVFKYRCNKWMATLWHVDYSMIGSDNTMIVTVVHCSPVKTPNTAEKSPSPLKNVFDILCSHFCP